LIIGCEAGNEGAIKIAIEALAFLPNASLQVYFFKLENDARILPGRQSAKFIIFMMKINYLCRQK